jgi:hypothetical protein
MYSKYVKARHEQRGRQNMHIRYLDGGYNESKRITTNSLWSMSSRGWSQLNNARFINYNSTKEERNKVKTSRRIHGNIILYTIQRTRLLQNEDIRITTNTRRIKRRTRKCPEESWVNISYYLKKERGQPWRLYITSRSQRSRDEYTN